jgi:hypothetical protein
MFCFFIICDIYETCELLVAHFVDIIYDKSHSGVEHYSSVQTNYCLQRGVRLYNCMVRNKVIDKEINAQRGIIRRLKREIFGIDKSGKSSYIKEFHSEFSRYGEVCTTEKVLIRAASSDIVYFGDYHPLKASQEWLLYLMRELSGRGRKVVLAVEMLYVQQQEQLDRWMKGTDSEEEFLAAIDYKSEWGFDWQSYRSIFELARDPFIPIFGIDSEPRDHLRYIRHRDRMIARRIKNIRKFFPGSLVLVMIGESHLAKNHLPAEITNVCDENIRETIIVQNMDEIYWSLLREGKEHIEAVMVDEGKYCIFNASPIVKYQSYREIIDIWVEGEEADRFVPILEEMVDYILSFLFGTGKHIKVTVNGTDFENIDDVFPEVHCRQTYKSFCSFLRAKGISQSGTVVATESLKRYGMSYVPALNTLLVLRFESPSAAMEAARFVLFAMRGGIHRRRRDSQDASNRFYRFVLEEALVYAGAKVVDSTIDCMKSDPLLRVVDSRGVVRRHSAGLSISETRSTVKMLKYHFKRELTASGVAKSTKKLENIYRAGLRKRLLLIRALGHTLGEAIYEGHYRGLVSTEELLALYRERASEPGGEKERYMKWVERTKPFRGQWSKRK